MNMKKFYLAVFAAALTLTACQPKTDDSSNYILLKTAAVDETVPETSSQIQTTAEEQPAQGESSAASDTASTPSGFIFTPFGKIQLYMHEEASAVLEVLGEPFTFLEAPSCAFQGTDRIYGYGSYEITTYEKDGKEYIYDIYFLDDSVTTDEGVYLGGTRADMEAAYGTGYIEESDSFTYIKDGMTLQFLIENDGIIMIRYNGAGQADTP